MLSGTNFGRNISSGGQHRQLVPGPEADERQPEPGEDPGPLDASGAHDELGGAASCPSASARPREAQGDVGLDGGRELGRDRRRSSPRCRPALARTDPACRRTRSARAYRMPRNSRKRRSSASMLTLVSSSPFHQPFASCMATRASTPRLRHPPRIVGGTCRRERAPEAPLVSAPWLPRGLIGRARSRTGRWPRARTGASARGAPARESRGRRPAAPRRSPWSRRVLRTVRGAGSPSPPRPR